MVRPSQLIAVLMLIIAGTFGTGVATAQSSTETISATLPKMVKIFGAGGLKGLHAYSTGMLVSPEGHIATVWSHVLDTDEVSVVLDDGRRYEAKVLGAEPQLDLAVLKIQEEGLSLPYFQLADAADVSAGTRVIAFSNMFKVASGSEPVSVLHGIIAAKTKVSARRGSFDAPYDGVVYVVDAITNNPGSGGGVLASRDGKLLGMIGKELRNRQTNTWINYAIPITELRDTIGQIITGNYRSDENPADRENPRRYATLDFGMVMVPDVVFRTPPYIDSVMPNSLAAKAGLETDDLVLFVNDELVQSNRALADALGYLEAGDTLRMIVRRGQKLVTLELPVERKPEQE